MKLDDLPDDIEELKRMVLAKDKEIQTTKQSLSNLAVTVVRQDKHIKALVQHIQSGKTAQAQQESSLPSGGYSNSQGGDTYDDEEDLEDEQDLMADVLKQQIDNANNYLDQLDGISSLPLPPPRASSPYQRRGVDLPPRSSTPQSYSTSSGSQNFLERRGLNKPPRPTTSGTLSDRNPLSARREQRESILSNMTRVPAIHRPAPGENGRAETPTRQSAALYNRQRTTAMRRPASVQALRQEQDYYDGGRYTDRPEFERIPERSATPTEGRAQYNRLTSNIRREGMPLYSRRQEEPEYSNGNQQFEGTPRNLSRRIQTTFDRDVRSVDNLRRSAGSAMSFRQSERIMHNKKESFRFDRQNAHLEDEFESDLRLDEMDGGHIDEDMPTNISTPRLARFANQQRFAQRLYQ